MEPREASRLPVPSPAHLDAAWAIIGDERAELDARLRQGLWSNVVKRVDQVLLCEVMAIPQEHADQLAQAARGLREKRIGREDTNVGQ
jgi:hypothetical protein